MDIKPQLATYNFTKVFYVFEKSFRRFAYCMSKKTLPILYSYLLFKIGQDFCDM